MTHLKTPQGFINLLQLLILLAIVTSYQVNCDDAYDTSHRVLPVDAEHQNKISKPLDAVCTQTIRDNLVKFLKRHPNPPRPPNRNPRQDDDGDEDEDGIAGVIANIQEGNGPLSTLQMLPSVLPQLVSTFTQLSGAVNQGLNGTDTPTFPSFLAKQGMEAIKFFQALAAGAGGGSSAPSRVPPETHHIQRIPGTDPIPMRKPRPGQVSEPYPGQVPGGTGPLQGVRQPSQQYQQQRPQYPGLDIDEYTDEDIKQYLQPTLPPLRPGNGGGGHQWGNFENQQGNFQNPGQNYNNHFQQQGGPDNGAYSTGGGGGAPNEMKTSLWQIYKTFKQRPGELGGLTDFQLAHPEAFSNELLQSISMAISSIRGMMGAMAAQGQGQGSQTEKPPTEILKEIFQPVQYSTESPTTPPPPPPQPVAPPSPQNTLASIFGGLKRPTLSVYKPSGSISGVAVDLTNLALNADQNVKTERPPQKVEETEAPSIVDVAEPSTHAPQGEVEVPPSSGVELGRPLNNGGTFIGTGTLDSLKAQQNTAKLVNALGPTRPPNKASPLFHLPGDTVSNLHDTKQSLQQVGPQTLAIDRVHGLNNNAPYTPVLNGILLEAPRLTPAPPSQYQKRPSDLYLNTESPQALLTQGSGPSQNYNPKPEFAYQVKNKERLPSNFHGPDPTTRRSPTLVAAIPSKFEYDQQQHHQIQEGDGVAPQNLFAKPTDAVPESDVGNSYVPQQQSQYAPPPPSPSPTPQYTPQQLQAQKLLQQLILLQRVLQRQMQMKLEQEQLAQNAALDSATVPPPPPQQPNIEEVQAQPSPSLQTKQVSSTIANGLASALINNNVPVGSSLLVPNKVNTENAQNSAPPQQQQNQPFQQQQYQQNSQLQQNQPLPQQQQNQPLPQQQQNQPLQYQPTPQQQLNQPYLNQQQNQPLQYQPTPQQQNQPPPQQEQNQPQQQNPPSPPPPPQNLPPFSSLVATSPQFGQNLLQAPSFPKPTTPAPSTTPPTTPQPSPYLSILNGSAISSETNLFPQFSNSGPSSYFPPAASPTNSEPSSNIAVPNTTSAQSSPNTPHQSNPPPAITTPIPSASSTPSLAALTPFQPFGSFPIQITDSKPYQPPSASAPTPPPTTTPYSLPSTSIQSTEFPPLPSFSFVHSTGPLFPGGSPVSSPGSPDSNSPSPSSLIIPAFPPPSPPRPHPHPSRPSQDPYQNLIRPHFQKPAQNGGYPQFVPSTPILVTSSGLVSPSQSSTPIPPTLEISSPLPLSSSSPSPFTALASLFSQKVKQTSALSEMAKLPYYQEDSFYPSAQKHIPSTPSPFTTPPPNYDEYDEQPSPVNVPPSKPPPPSTTPSLFNELFPIETTPIPNPPPSPSNSSSLPNYTVAEENDSAEEQPYPDFPPNKPIYWMNMFYPNGVPVLTKVTEPTLPQSSTPKPPKKRRLKSTTTLSPFPAAIVTEPEVEYYDVEEPDENGIMIMKSKKRLKAAVYSDTDIQTNENTTTTAAPSS